MSSQHALLKPVLLVLSSTYPRWHADTEPAFVHELARRLTDSFDVVVSCPHAKGAKRYEVMDGVRVFRYRYAPDAFETLVHNGGIVGNLRKAAWKIVLIPPFLFAQFWAAIQLCRRVKPSVLHAHWLIPQGTIAAVLEQTKLGPRFVVTSHGADLYALRGNMLERVKRWVISRASSVTVVSAAMRNEVLRLGMGPDRVQVLPMGVDLSGRFTPDKRITRVPGRMLFVGRLVEKKGLQYLLRALPVVAEKEPKAELWIAGFGPDRAMLEKLVRALGIAKRVNFLGAVSQESLPRLLRTASLFVCPFIKAADGDEEGLGLVVAEAIGCGCPVLAGDVVAMREYGVDVVDVRNEKALAAAVVAALRSEDEGFSKIESLRRLCLERFDWSLVANEYRKLLREVGR